MDKEYNLVAVIRTLLNWKMPILAITLTAGIAAALFSLFVMDEYFFSWSTFYPTNQALTNRNAIFNPEGTPLDYFGDKGDVNRTLTIANSAPVIEYILDSFKIATHYKIDTNKRFWRTKMRKAFEENYSAIKTERDAVEISLYDTDPQLAADIVNAIVAKVDELNKKHFYYINLKTAEAIGDQVLVSQKAQDAYIDSLANLGERYKIKVSASSDGTMLVEGNDYRAVQLYKTIMAKQTAVTRELNNLTAMKSQMDVSLQNSESSLFVLEQAFAADRRTKPVRSLVVALTMLITFFVSIVGVLLIEQFAEIKKQL